MAVEHTWPEDGWASPRWGKLGLTLVERRLSGVLLPGALVEKVAPELPATIRPGMLVERVAETETACLPLSEVRDTIKAAGRPITLCFHQPLARDAGLGELFAEFGGLLIGPVAEAGLDPSGWSDGPEAAESQEQFVRGCLEGWRELTDGQFAERLGALRLAAQKAFTDASAERAFSAAKQSVANPSRLKWIRSPRRCPRRRPWGTSPGCRSESRWPLRVWPPVPRSCSVTGSSTFSDAEPFQTYLYVVQCGAMIAQ